MQCSECRFENPDDGRFCQSCGVPLARGCASCGYGNLADARFCGGCGAALGQAEPVSAQATPPASEAERRQLTVLFCDLVGSTALSARLDPEDMRELLRAYQDACAGAITRYDGFVAKFMGDGVYAYFGYPTAHEDDAERAVSAGLGIVAAVGGLKRDLAVRIGIATGTVAVGDIVGEGASEEAAIVGQAPNLAARLQDIAEPDTVVIGEATRVLVGELFETADLGARDLKGFDGPAGAWAVLRPRRVESRFAATRGGRLSELVGRAEEMEILLRRWQRTKSGKGQVALISGEPGIGKSRLAHAFRDAIEVEAPYVRILQCSPHHTNSAMFPFIGQTLPAIGISPDDTNGEKLDKLEAWLRLADQPAEQIAPVFGPILGIDTTERFAPSSVSPRRQKEMIFDAFAERLTRISARQPMLIMVEDAHWIDPSSLEMVNIHIEQARDLAVMVVVTYRPEFAAPWVGQPHSALLALNRLDRADCTALAASVSGRGNLSDELIERIAKRTDGVPLFVEELTKAILESSDGTAAVPATLQDSLEARLDRLGPAKEIAQIGSVIGREFRHDLLSSVAEFNDARLADGLDRLVRSELVLARGQPPDAVYSFKHALIQDTAYDSLLRGRRRELHGRIARALESPPGGEITATPEIIGHHHAQAGNDRAAVACFLEAGTEASDRYAMEEALAHLTRAWEMVERLPENDARLELEAEIHMARGLTLKVVQGVGSTEALDALSRSLDIGRRIGRSGDVLTVLANMANTEAARGRFEEATKHVATLFELSRTRNDAGSNLAAHFIEGIIRFHTGDSLRCQDNFRHCLDNINAWDAVTFERKYRFEFNTGPRFRLGNALLIQGFPDQAAALAEDAVGHARRREQPLAIVSALMFGCFTLIWRGDHETVREWAEESLRIADEHGFAQHQGWSKVCAGWALARQGHPERSLEAVAAGVAQFRDTGRKTWLAWWLMLQAEIHLLDQDADKAFSCADEALAGIDAIGERQFQSPANSLKGEILAALARADEAESHYLDALDVARAQSARSWELRAAIRLARLWHGQGRTAEASDLLMPVYGWFTEGFETADLKDAKVLLGEMA